MPPRACARGEHGAFLRFASGLAHGLLARRPAVVLDRRLVAERLLRQSREGTVGHAVDRAVHKEAVDLGVVQAERLRGRARKGERDCDSELDAGEAFHGLLPVRKWSLNLVSRYPPGAAGPGAG